MGEEGIDLSADLGRLRIDPAIMNASGIFSFPSTLLTVSRCLGGVVLKSTGYEPREGNEPPVFVQCSEDAYLNAMGLPNPGYRAMREELEESYPLFEKAGKKVIVSVFAETPERFAEIIRHLDPVCDGFEGNYSCPNITPGEKVGISIGNDPGRVAAYTKAAREATEKLFMVKFGPGPYSFDRGLAMEIAHSAVENGADALAVTNTIPGGMKIDWRARRPVLSTRYGGMSGKGIMPIGVGFIHALHEAFPDVPKVGIGGIEGGEDVLEYVEAGADAVQMGTAFTGKGTGHASGYIEALVEELKDLMEGEGIGSLKELKGTAHGP